jgi:hypothetical protein
MPQNADKISGLEHHLALAAEGTPSVYTTSQNRFHAPRTLSAEGENDVDGCPNFHRLVVGHEGAVAPSAHCVDGSLSQLDWSADSMQILDGSVFGNGGFQLYSA